MIEIQRARRGRAQPTGGQSNLRTQTIARPVDRGLERDRPQVRQMRQGADQALGRLIGFDHRLDGRGGHAARHRILTRTIKPLHIKLGSTGRQARQLRRSIQPQCRGNPNNRGADHSLIDMQMAQIDLDRQVERSAAAGFLALGNRQPGHINPLRLQLVDPSGAVDQGQRRPVENQARDRQVRPFRVRDLNLAKPQGVRKAAGQTLNTHHAAGQASGLGFNQAAADIKIGGDQNNDNRQHWDRQQHQHDHTAQLQQAADQNACPMPI
jgi:hypothetical protein